MNSQGSNLVTVKKNAKTGGNAALISSGGRGAFYAWGSLLKA